MNSSTVLSLLDLSPTPPPGLIFIHIFYYQEKLIVCYCENSLIIFQRDFELSMRFLTSFGMTRQLDG
jgi:hypothetical protein